jgi:hypothetical protein
MSPILKNAMANSVNKGKRYQKTYYGKYEAERSTNVYDTTEIHTFVNYGIKTTYCEKHNCVRIRTQVETKKGMRTSISHDTVNCRFVHIRLLREELAEITSNNYIIPKNLYAKIISREM